MRPNRIQIIVILLAALFLTACSAATTRNDSESAETSPSAAEINAAAEQAATQDPATSIPTETVPAESALPDLTEAPAVETTTDETSVDGTPEDETPADETPGDVPSSESGPRINRRVDVPELYVNWLLPWDGIRPVYDPEFATAEEAPLDDEELIIGISLEGEAKAYPITVLRFREMVNDEMAGIPTLVTW
jgi:hypothetical protein